MKKDERLKYNTKHTRDTFNDSILKETNQEAF